MAACLTGVAGTRGMQVKEKCSIACCRLLRICDFGRCRSSYIVIGLIIRSNSCECFISVLCLNGKLSLVVFKGLKLNTSTF